MLRKSHSLPGVWGAILVFVMTVTGALLSLAPLSERLGAFLPAYGGMNVAQLADKVTEHYPGATQLERTPNGTIIVYFNEGDHTGADIVNPLTGDKMATYEPSSWMRWVKSLHRSFFLDTEGRIITGLGAICMLILCISGAYMLAIRMGGWRKLSQPMRGTTSERLHGCLGRIAIIGLLMSSVTGLYLSATTLGLIPEVQEAEPVYPDGTMGTGKPLPTASLPALQAIDVNDLRELLYPYPDDPADNFSLVTKHGAAYISPVTGMFATPFQPHDLTYQIHELIYQLHTGEGLWWLGIILGLSALMVPVMTVTGLQIWWKRRCTMPRLTHNSRANMADTIILVGSETNMTWGFAKTLHEALVQAGFRVHTAAMNHFAKEYRQVERMFLLAATYGDGGPPASGNHFFSRLAKLNDVPTFRYAVLGFGDRQFPKFCQFAIDVDAALNTKGWKRLLPLDMIDRQSAQEFARWGNAVSEVLDIPLTLIHQPERPHTITLQLLERVDYGGDAREPATVFRFNPLQHNVKRRGISGIFRKNVLPSFEAGDLVGIFPPGSDVPRFYSLASSATDGVLEICVRKHSGGLCSGYLHGLTPGDSIEAFIKLNPHFRPAITKAPVILIGAGTGIGPLAGFIRHNTPGHPMYLYWGGRNPQTDFLYKPELCRYLEDQRLTRLSTAFSRGEDNAYVQDKIVADATELRRLVQKGAQILVCGGRAMAQSVTEAIDEILAPLNLTVQSLKAEGRYREDVY